LSKQCANQTELIYTISKNK